MSNSLPTVVFLPGWGCKPELLWKHQIAALYRRAHCIPLPLEDYDSIERMAGAVLDATQTESQSKAIVIAGLSMGGMVALHFAHRFPDLTQGLFLVATTAKPEPTDEAGIKRLRSVVTMEKKLGDYPVFHPVIHGSLFHKKNECVTNDMRAAFSGTTYPVMARQGRAIVHREGTTGLHAAWDKPVAVLGGKQDLIVLPHQIEALAQEFPDGVCHKVLIDNCGHTPPLEQPEQVTIALLSLLSRVHTGTAQQLALLP